VTPTFLKCPIHLTVIVVCFIAMSMKRKIVFFEKLMLNNIPC